MIAEPTRNMLRLLSQVILSDGHIYPSEVEAFAESVQRLELKDMQGDPLTQAQARQWFTNYLEELNEVWSTEPKDVVLTRLVLSLADWPDKKAVVQTLESISLADADFHVEEKRLISIVRTFWQYDGLDAPGATIIH